VGDAARLYRARLVAAGLTGDETQILGAQDGAKVATPVGRGIWRDGSAATSGRGIEAGESRLVDKIAAFPISYPG
jgi:hypothetical protein